MTKTIIVSIILCLTEIIVIVVASPMAKPSLILSFLPEDVRLVAKNHPEPSKSKQILAYFLFILFIVAMIGAMVYLGIDGIKNNYGFWKLTLRFMVMLYINKAFDIIVQDQWLVMTVGYFKKIFPETTNCKGWKDRSFNNKNQIKRIVAYPFLCMMTAGLFILFS